MYNFLDKDPVGKNTIYKLQHPKYSTRNARTLLYYVPITTYNIINWKRLCVPVIHFYKLLRFRIRRHFSASLPVRVFDSGQPVNCASKYHTKNICQKLHLCIPARPTRHYTLLDTPNILHTKTLLAPACHPHKKILSKAKL